MNIFSLQNRKIRAKSAALRCTYRFKPKNGKKTASRQILHRNAKILQKALFAKRLVYPNSVVKVYIYGLMTDWGLPNRNSETEARTMAVARINIEIPAKFFGNGVA